MFCSQCGVEIINNAKYCHICGELTSGKVSDTAIESKNEDKGSEINLRLKALEEIEKSEINLPLKALEEIEKGEKSIAINSLRDFLIEKTKSDFIAAREDDISEEDFQKRLSKALTDTRTNAKKEATEMIELFLRQNPKLKKLCEIHEEKEQAFTCIGGGVFGILYFAFGDLSKFSPDNLLGGAIGIILLLLYGIFSFLKLRKKIADSEKTSSGVSFDPATLISIIAFCGLLIFLNPSETEHRTTILKQLNEQIKENKIAEFANNFTGTTNSLANSEKLTYNNYLLFSTIIGPKPESKRLTFGAFGTVRISF